MNNSVVLNSQHSVIEQLANNFLEFLQILLNIAAVTNCHLYMAAALLETSMATGIR